MPGTAVLVAVRRAERGGLFFVRVERRLTAAVVVLQPRLEARFVAATAWLLRPKVEILLVEVTIVVPDDDHVVRLEEHVQALVELHVPFVLGRLGRFGAATCRRPFQRRLFRPRFAAVA